MPRSVKAVPVVLLAFALAGCTAGVAATTPAPAPRPSGAVAVDGGYDLGNARPLVTNDGLMVRRRVVVAVYPTAGASVVSLRKELDSAAARAHTSLSSIPPGVLDPALLEPNTPAMTLALPPKASLADARRLASSEALSSSGVPVFRVDSVLVHDLRFTVSSARPAALAAAIAGEGILSDALGRYTTTLGRHRLDITYTGPLLSDDLVESVRAGIARRAHTPTAAVTISPRSVTGVGVDMAKEPAVVPVVTGESVTHRHTAALPAAKASSQPLLSSPWAVAAIALAALLILTLVLLMVRRTSIRRISRSDES